MRPDVIVTWPVTCDYPPWRELIKRERARFNRVHVAWSARSGEVDYRELVESDLAGVADFYDATERGGRDWRDVAVNLALNNSDADWVWFTEQDLLPHDETLLLNLERALLVDTPVGRREDDRWHPSCLLVQREAIERTSRYFGPEPVDHFHTFGRELSKNGDAPLDLVRLGVERDVDYVHLQGLSQNHQLIELGRYDQVFRPDKLAAYLAQARFATDVELHPTWIEQVNGFLGWYHGRDDG